MNLFVRRGPFEYRLISPGLRPCARRSLPLQIRHRELEAVIAEGEPPSIRETAVLVGRDYKQVLRNITELSDIGVIAFEGGGPGRAKRPMLAYDGLEIEVPLG